MKVLQIINSLGTGGAEKLLLDTIPLYRKAGVKMDLLLLWDNGSLFAQKLRELNCCNIYVLNKSNDYRSIYNPLNIFKIRKYLKKYDIIHVHLFPALYFTRFANLGINKPLIFTEHNTSNKRISNRRYAIIEKWCYSGYRRLVTISYEIYTIYSNYLKNPDKLIIIENGINLEIINKAEAHTKFYISNQLNDQDILILQVSGFRNQKDQDTLIKALMFLPTHFKVILVGDGDRRPVLVKLAKSLGLENRVIFLGIRVDVPELLKSVDIVVLSSYYEGLSLASVEALASGKPFIASDVPGLREVVEDAGLLFPLGDEKELARLIKNLTQSQEYNISVVEKCLKRALNYDINIMIKKHIDLYKDVYKEI